MTDSADPIPPVLAYADTSTNELPDRFEAVERLLDANEPVWKLATMFPTSNDAATYVVRSLAGRFQPVSTGETCEGCGQPCPTVSPIYWRVRIAAKVSEVVHTTNSMPSERMLTTYHTLCAGCHRVSAVRKYAKPWRAVVGIVLTIVGIAAIAVNGIYQKVSTGQGLEAFGAVALCVGLSLAALSLNTVRCTPPKLLTDRLPPDLVPAGVGSLFEWPRAAKGGTS